MCILFEKYSIFKMSFNKNQILFNNPIQIFKIDNFLSDDLYEKINLFFQN